MLTEEVEQASEWTVGTSARSYRLIRIHKIDRQQSLLLLLREDTPNLCVVTHVKFYGTFYESNESSMPAARENSLMGGKAKECSKNRRFTRARPKDKCSCGANVMPDEQGFGSR